MKFKTMLNLEKQFTFYASYHNQVNFKLSSSKNNVVFLFGFWITIICYNYYPEELSLQLKLLFYYKILVLGFRGYWLIYRSAVNSILKKLVYLQLLYRGWWNGVHVHSELRGMLVRSYIYRRFLCRYRASLNYSFTRRIILTFFGTFGIKN